MGFRTKEIDPDTLKRPVDTERPEQSVLFYGADLPEGATVSITVAQGGRSWATTATPDASGVFSMEVPARRGVLRKLYDEGFGKQRGVGDISHTHEGVTVTMSVQ